MVKSRGRWPPGFAPPLLEISDGRRSNLQYVSGLSPEERDAGMQSAANWIDNPHGTGFNGHVVGIVAGRFWVDCTLAQASVPEMGFVIVPDVLIIPLPKKRPPIDSTFVRASVKVGKLDVEVKWWGSGDRSFEATEVWEPSRLVESARIVANEIIAASPPARYPHGKRDTGRNTASRCHSD